MERNETSEEKLVRQTAAALASPMYRKMLLPVGGPHWQIRMQRQIFRMCLDPVLVHFRGALL